MLAAHGPRALWLRWTLTATATGTTTRRWAMIQGPTTRVAHIDDGAEPWPRGLGADSIDAEIGPVGARLNVWASPVTHRHVPDAIAAVGRTYVPEMLDARIDGEVSVQGQIWPISQWRGVVGHLYGRSNRIASWTWVHCNRWDGADAAFECLSARLVSQRLPALTSMVLAIDGEVYRYSSVADLALARVTRQSDGVSIRSRKGPTQLEATVQLGERPFHLRYGGEKHHWNVVHAPRSPISLTLQSPDRPARRLTGHAFLERGVRVRGGGSDAAE